MTDSIAPISPISPTSQSNFLSRNLRPGTEAFFNSPLWASNELQLLSTLEGIDAKAQKKGLQQIKDSIE